MDPLSALAAAARQEGFWNKAAALIRNLQRNHTFQDANKRSAQEILEVLKQRNNIRTGVSQAETRRIIEDIAAGRLDDIREIARRLRGF
jgi:prophage maintenance system killer protein